MGCGIIRDPTETFAVFAAIWMFFKERRLHAIPVLAPLLRFTNSV